MQSLNSIRIENVGHALIVDDLERFNSLLRTSFVAYPLPGFSNLLPAAKHSA
jgi:hypothetical protein